MTFAISALLLLALPAPALTAADGAPYLARAAGSANGAAFAEGPAHAVAAAKGRARAITLITGDTVRLGQGGGHAIERGPGRENITFAIDQVGDRLRVVPSDAAPLLASGLLDSRLFDVSNLLDFDYDRHRHLPLIISYDGSTAKSRVHDRAAAAGARVVRELPTIDALAVHAEGKDRTRFWAELTARGLKAAGVKKVWLDGRMRPTLETSVPQIGAPAAWERGLTGAGVKVGVVDTGVDATHPDLAGRIAGQRNFTIDPDEDDVVGHGTHVASTIVGGGEASGGRNRGVAHGATVLSAKVCTEWSCEESAIIAGMQWTAEQGAKVVNLSLGGWDLPGIDPMEQALEDLTARHGTLFVVSAGNNATERSVGSPGSADSALTVGAVDRNEQRAAFSSQGPRVGDHALKPDITAPGVGIVAARSTHTQEGQGPYHAMSGTSMAAPHVAGAAAIVAAQHPEWTPAQLKAALMASARPGQIGVFGQGAGRVDVTRATTQFVTANPPGLGFGQQRWPHTDDEPITRTLTYTNAGSAPVTLDLAVRALDSAGRPLDAALFTVTPRSVTVAAGGNAEVSVTADTRGDLPDTPLGGYLTATGGGITVSTPLGVDREVESHDLTLNQTDRDGRPATSVMTVLRRLEGADDVIMLSGQQASTTLRLPKGTWSVGTTFLGAARTLLVHPGLALTGPRTLDLDARLGLPLSVTPPDPKVKQVDAQLGYRGQRADGSPFFSLISRPSFETLYGAQLGGDQTYPHAMSKVSGTWALPSAEGGTDNSPYLYHLGYFTAGRMVTGFQRAVTQQELATVKVDYAQQLAGTAGSTAAGPQPQDSFFPHWYAGSRIALPSVQTEYVNTDDGIRWQRSFRETDAQEDEVQAISGRAATYQRGRTHAEQWNRGVFAPTGGAEAAHDAIIRTGDRISVNFNFYHGDGQGRPGYSRAPRQRSALYRDGRLVAEGAAVHSQLFHVPPEAATYRVETEAERDEPFTSTRVFAAWTFRSEHAPGTVRLPSATISFAPALNNRNISRGGVPLAVPVTVWQTPGTGAGGRLKDLNVEMSTDDGATWSTPKLVRTPAGGVVFLRNPATGHVSLRAKATDASGNTVEQTIIRAYRTG
ncbi:S8 family serine peptidase [Nonomuraea dietziae]|uniref:S8 family serine peptidase n=1 Tax=Nonomuraea dietziae TaxID=65515 RepID=UPI00342CCDFA